MKYKLIAFIGFVAKMPSISKVSYEKHESIRWDDIPQDEEAMFFLESLQLSLHADSLVETSLTQTL